MTILDSDDLHLKYDSCLVDSINSEIFKKTALSQGLFATSRTAGNEGQSVWMKEPFKRNNQLDQERLALSQASKQTCEWLMEFLNEAMLHFCNWIFEASIVLLIMKSFWNSKLAHTKYTWQTCWNSIQDKLLNEDPCIRFESLIMMARP